MKCKRCGYKSMREQPVMELYNKNGEFVVGYGHSQVWIQKGVEYICEACGFNQSKSLSDVLPRPSTFHRLLQE